MFESLRACHRDPSDVEARQRALIGVWLSRMTLLGQWDRHIRLVIKSDHRKTSEITNPLVSQVFRTHLMAFARV